MPHLFFDTLIAKSLQSPDMPFFQFYNGSGCATLSYSEARHKIAAGSAWLRSKGVNNGDVVLIFAQHGKGMLLSFFGAQWHGAIPAFMPPPTAKQDSSAWVANHTTLIQRIKPALIIAEPDCLSLVQALSNDLVVSMDDIENAPAVADLEPVITPEDLDRVAFLQHSSGTTGLKKGVMVTYRQLLSQLNIYAKRLYLNPAQDCIVSWLPLYHDMGLIAATLLPFYFGLPVKIIDTFAWLSNPSLLILLLTEVKNAYCWLPNFAFNYLARRTRLDLGPDDLSGVKAIINCSEPCKLEDMQAFTRRFQPHGLRETAVQVCYAMAEYVFAVSQTDLHSVIGVLEIDAEAFETHHIAQVEISSAPARIKAVVSVGHPVDQVEVRINNDILEDRVGEISVRGPSMSSGYLRNDELTRIKFANGWYHTGDLGFLHGGELYITGRKDDLIIVRGKNIYAHDLEEVMTATEGVKAGRSVAFGVEDKASGTQQLVLVAELEDGTEVKQVVHDIYNRIYDSFGIAPANIVPVALNSLSKTTSGKISRSENSKKYIENALEALKMAP